MIYVWTYWQLPESYITSIYHVCASKDRASKEVAITFVVLYISCKVQVNQCFRYVHCSLEVIILNPMFTSYPSWMTVVPEASAKPSLAVRSAANAWFGQMLVWTEDLWNTNSGKLCTARVKEHHVLLSQAREQYMGVHG